MFTTESSSSALRLSPCDSNATNCPLEFTTTPGPELASARSPAVVTLISVVSSTAPCATSAGTSVRARTRAASPSARRADRPDLRLRRRGSTGPPLALALLVEHDRTDRMLVGQFLQHLVDHRTDVVLLMPEVIEQAAQRRVGDLELRGGQLEVVVELLGRISAGVVGALRIVHHGYLQRPRRHERSVTLRVTVLRSPALLRASTVSFAFTVRPLRVARLTARLALIESRSLAWLVR